ncbi:amidase [Dactylosporangium matsuzakiense]|uniref:Amidase n=1 Tax=Dactylosporangium matsuzakiense TaxID=53360 RepID=A0A9W6KF79_9ACTN|nr:amidase [Dactylosporangium matsuzakiense]GLK99195.1 amidase [Dactylosporangium matsuzakiense]
MDELLEAGAVQTIAALRSARVSPAQLLDAVAARIAETEPRLHTMTTVCLDRARSRAAGNEGPLAGLPVTVKDVVDVEGVPTTFGSEPYRGNVPRRSDRLVRRIEAGGGVIVGKTNLPEFSAGADTVSAVGGRTLNPADASVSCGASSGGAAASVAAHQVWLAHGADTAGSVRIPAAFCGVVGVRPTPGLVTTDHDDDPSGLEVHGPLARTAADAALFLRVMAARSLPAPEPGARLRIAFSANLGGAARVEDGVAAACARALPLLVRLGHRVEEQEPPVRGVHDACLVLLGRRAVVLHAGRVERLGPALGPALRAEVRAGLEISPEQVAAAQHRRAGLRAAMAAFFGRFDVLVTPVFGTGPWPLPTGPSPYPDEPHLSLGAAGWPLTTLAPMAGCPAVAVPCGTAGGLPVGLQLLGAPDSDLRLLHLAADLEAAGLGRADPAAATAGPAPDGRRS